MNQFVRSTFLVALLAIACSIAPASIIPVDYWSLGGGSGFDPVGGVTQYSYGTGYSDSTSLVPFEATFILAETTANFGMEIVADPTANANATVFYNGNTTDAGWGLYETCASAGADCSSAAWSVLYGGQPLFLFAPVALNHMVALAFVNDGTTTTLYVDGVPTSSALYLPHPPNDDHGAATIGMNTLGGETFSGTLSNAEIFTFDAGQFSPSDLNSLPEPSHLAALGLGLIFAIRRIRHRSVR
jgi:hypothetical protein